MPDEPQIPADEGVEPAASPSVEPPPDPGALVGVPEEPLITDELTPPAGLNLLERHLWYSDRLRERGIVAADHPSEHWPFLLRGLPVPGLRDDVGGDPGPIDPAVNGSGRFPSSADVPVAEPQRPRLQFLTGTEFLAQPLSRIEPLVGNSIHDALLMPGSLALLAGVGGSGKTTLSMHAIAHWASGTTWFGIKVQRPLKIMVIENEGPHDPFVLKMKEFAERWQGCPCGGDHAETHGDGGAFVENLLFLDAPWGHFTWADVGLAEELRQQALAFDCDLVIANPLGRLGMRGAGTPEETRAFLDLLVHGGLGDTFAALLNHHMSKVGQKAEMVQQLSGDWGPHPDTILTLENDGVRRSKLTFAKMRWGDQGRDPILLEWLTDENGPIGYRTKAAIAGVPDDVMFERLDEFLEDQAEAVGMTEIRRAVQGNSKRITELVRDGAKTGRYWSSGGHRPKFRVASKAPAVQTTFGEEPEIPWQATPEGS